MANTQSIALVISSFFYYGDIQFQKLSTPIRELTKVKTRIMNFQELFWN